MLFIIVRFLAERAFTLKIEGAGINVSRCFICGCDNSVNIACINKYIKKWDFLVDIDFLCEIENKIILKGHLCCVNFISAIGEKEYVVSYLR